MVKTNELLNMVSQNPGIPYIRRSLRGGFVGYPDGIDDISVISFRSGENQIDISTYKMKQGWKIIEDDSHGKIELADGEEPLHRLDGMEIRENGRLLWQDASMCVSTNNESVTGQPLKYRYESFTRGNFSTKEDAMQYLQEKYPDVEWQTTYKAAEHKLECMDYKWLNEDWQKNEQADEFQPRVLSSWKKEKPLETSDVQMKEESNEPDAPDKTSDVSQSSLADSDAAHYDAYLKKFSDAKHAAFVNAYFDDVYKQRMADLESRFYGLQGLENDGSSFDKGLGE